MQIDNEKLLKLGKKYQKWLEATSVNLDAYKINGNAYYLANYTSKFSTKIKAYAVISPDSNDKEEAMQAISPHFYFSISSNNILDSTAKRAKRDFSVLEKIRDYLKIIVESEVLDPKKEIIYQRSLNILQSMTDLQYEMIQLWEGSQSLENTVVERGVFTDTDIEKVMHYVILTDLIQYKQFKDRYDNCKDFDVIYENRNNPEIKPYEKYLDSKILKGMTSEAAEDQLKGSLDRLTQNQYLGNMSESEIYDKWMKSYKEGLDTRVQKEIKMLRYP
ncbi:dsDNA-binding SOS-regulon protein [Virgibacillus natechei]|uniref:DsDNA-binding SOS-regulon protein n=1 Tax=Virgibacillus natechei TaxID=1216297 RepID=A0ABS4IKI8_9BACI|nr:hypothetical protein [Virgibacillus natechei]MBP1971429.1 dsDNA-binding SOS-regulon protein [Virgibacillus natechei]UZD13799.1 hypothetical protein OLD84_04405 [Virgibacillus natechei]